MKRIITLGVVLALVAPALLLAQTVDYYGFDNSTKTELVSWIETAIDNGSVSFDTQAHKDAYLGLINDLYAARNAADWDECIAVANSLAVASGNIVGNNSALAASICECVAAIYSISDTILIPTKDVLSIKEATSTGNPNGVVMEADERTKVHASKTVIIKTSDGTEIITSACTYFYVIPSSLKPKT